MRLESFSLINEGKHACLCVEIIKENNTRTMMPISSCVKTTKPLYNFSEGQINLQSSTRTYLCASDHIWVCKDESPVQIICMSFLGNVHGAMIFKPVSGKPPEPFALHGFRS